MGRKQVSGFPVFASYAWHGADVAAVEQSLEIPLRNMSAELERASRLDTVGGAWKLSQEAWIVPSSDRVVARFEPEDRPRLFLELASAYISSTGIAAFVGRNGNLGGYDFVDESGDRRPCQLDTFWSFVWNAKTMKRVLGLVVDLHSETDTNKRIAIQSDLASRINTRLSQVTPRLDGSLRLTSQNDRLIDAIWLQLAKAIEMGRQISRCEHCGKFFEVAGGLSRADKSYCGNTCKVAAYRDRKRTAAKRRAAGATLREIAKEIGSDVQTIKGWLAEKGER